MRTPAAATCLSMVLAAGCGSPGALPPIEGASAQRGAAALQRLDCGVCHRIPGIRGARGQVGPSLEHYARRIYVAGKFPHDAAHLVRWIQDPPALVPHTAMPSLGLSGQEARDIAAYLHTLR